MTTEQRSYRDLAQAAINKAHEAIHDHDDARLASAWAQIAQALATLATLDVQDEEGS